MGASVWAMKRTNIDGVKDSNVDKVVLMDQIDELLQNCDYVCNVFFVLAICSAFVCFFLFCIDSNRLVFWHAGAAARAESSACDRQVRERAAAAVRLLPQVGDRRAQLRVQGEEELHHKSATAPAAVRASF